jgi:aminomethyltransferase
MLEKSPFFERTQKLNLSLQWKDWSGYAAARYYGSCHEPEYYALRQACGLIDVTPLFKYEVSGPDAAGLLGWVMTRNINRLKVGQVGYTCWCDEQGKLVDDGTVTRLSEEHFRVTSADPSYVWFERHSAGFDVEIEESTRKLGALSLQGPSSRALLQAVTADDMAELGFFRHCKTRIGNVDVDVTRTGYTGDLGFEIWVPSTQALPVWDALMAAGNNYGLLPVGLDAMDMTRVEAGFVLNGIDYFSARHCTIESRKSSPYELALGWTVHFKNRGEFIGKAALQADKENGTAFQFVGLEASWEELETLYDAHRLPPSLPAAAWRSPVPIYLDDGRTQIGYATSGTWSPLLKKNIAMGCVESQFAQVGNILRMEVTVEFERKTISARVVERPFFDPPRKKN